MPRKQPKCRSCVTTSLYSEEHDAYYCKECDTWNEVKCSDPDCEFCKDRPETPSYVISEPFQMIAVLKEKLTKFEIQCLVRLFNEGSLKNVFHGTISTNGLIDADKENFPSLYNGDKDEW